MTARTLTDIASGRARPIRHLPDISTHLAFWLPVANVVMQLANPAVGHGVVESRVDRGRGDLRPIKRARTTAQYLAVATLGSDSDRRFFHEAVHRIHARVTFTASSPVRYNANDAGSQLWVALCLVRYYTDQWQMIHGPLTEAELDRIIEMARPLGTTLNVPEARWPATWAEYEKRFADGLVGGRATGASADRRAGTANSCDRRPYRRGASANDPDRTAGGRAVGVDRLPASGRAGVRPRWRRPIAGSGEGSVP
ncbi:hypothetical protein SAMN06265174_104152 [Dietzia kunjamensis subsp. schimae]|uniref:ER-bound oxygenase mpaB/mpaB'/Rubber oxygenase catalytic domain-containing protein n=1 Tax=Dietzia kunjamensis subsp. schimae TaxID=498198 RepID=A0ABY1N193_9ACTN|nr:oxygenase MpaB family protein [Dietzia kunjamensis]SMO71808.1 hypothetical protein SAMN06265174_104152 [Dietzia kunjamensis subsp. schimae]